MQQGDRSRANYGTLEKWTVALFALGFILSLPGLIAAIICLAFAQYWTVTEKLVAVFVPTLIAVAVAMLFTGLDATQSWLRIPMMLLVVGISQLAGAIFLYTRGRSERASVVAAN